MARLIREGFEVARPIRDRGIDLIVYGEGRRDAFRAVPIQLKSYRREGFAVSRKYRDRHLVMIYVWHAFADEPKFIVIGHEAMVRLLPAKTRRTKSWRQKGGWSQTKVSEEKRLMLLSYEDNWQLISKNLGPLLRRRRSRKRG